MPPSTVEACISGGFLVQASVPASDTVPLLLPLLLLVVPLLLPLLVVPLLLPLLVVPPLLPLLPLVVPLLLPPLLEPPHPVHGP